jgi:hypothetical protein
MDDSKDRITFTTFPSNEFRGKFSFALGSCALKVWMPLKGFSDIYSKDPTFVLYMGGMIYTEEPVYLGNAKSNFETKYREVYADEHFQKLTRSVPLYAMCILQLVIWTR